MKITVIFISTFLTWVAFDYNLFRRRRETYSLTAIELSIADAGEVATQKKKVQQQRLDVIPPHLRKRAVKLYSKCSYVSAKSRDHRDSNQRSLRRKFNNM
ncbi:hypothetical protein CIK05_01810 [Bdellovibrio sp. qaytius]|nr:hypothetical protein CIK05_01810 [Bdellovibrio sp. qaytius]